MSYASIRKMHRDAMPVPGLPEPLPENENLLWQGSPDFRTLARSAFHSRALTIYFVVILGLHAINQVWSAASAKETLIGFAWLTPLFAAALAMVYAMAWFTARTTVYSITSKRVVMQVGVVLDLTLNLPFEAIESAQVRLIAFGHGDLPLHLMGANKIAYFHLWPHARPWRLAKPEPMLRSVADAENVARILGDAVRAHLAAKEPSAPVLRLVPVEHVVDDQPIAMTS